MRTPFFEFVDKMSDKYKSNMQSLNDDKAFAKALKDATPGSVPPKVMKAAKKAAKEVIRDVFKDCTYRGTPVSELASDEQEKAYTVLATESLKRILPACKVMPIVQGKMQDEVHDKALDCASASADLMLSISMVAGEHPEPDFDRDTTTITKLPRNKVTGDMLIAVLYALGMDTLAHAIDTDDPVKLHTLAYNVFALMAIAEARVAARAYVKPIDTFGLLNGVESIKLCSGDLPFYEGEPKEGFLRHKIMGNEKYPELKKNMDKEEEKLQKFAREFCGGE